MLPIATFMAHTAHTGRNGFTIQNRTAIPSALFILVTVLGPEPVLPLSHCERHRQAGTGR